MSIRTHWFYQTSHIAGIPGEFHAGQVVDVDENTMTVIATRLMDAPPQTEAGSEPTDKGSQEEPNVAQEDYLQTQLPGQQVQEDILE